MLATLQKYLTPFSILLLGFVTLFVLTPFNGVQLIALGVFSVVCLGYFLVRDRAVTFQAYDLGVLGFCLYGLLSISWSANIALCWTAIFSWLGLGLLVLVFRTLWGEVELRKPIMGCLLGCFVLLLVAQLYAIHMGLPEEGTAWRHFFNRNRNYTTSHLIVLYPFLLSIDTKSKFLRFLSVSSGLLIISICLNTQAYGALLGFAGLLLFFMVDKYLDHIPCGWKRSITLLPLVAVGIATITFAVSLGALYPNGSGVTLIESGREVAKDAPILGHGINQSFVALSQHTDFSSVLTREAGHHLFLSTLGEMGIPGLLLLIWMLGWPLYRGVCSPKASLQKAASMSLLCYIVFALFYRDANNYMQHFSSMQFVAFASIGIITSHTHKAYKAPRYVILLLICLSILVTIWYTYERQVYKTVTGLILEESFKPQALEDVYNPTFFTHYDLWPIDYLLYQEYKNLSDKDKARRTKERLTSLEPFVQVE